jgi:WD40 repeat protein
MRCVLALILALPLACVTDTEPVEQRPDARSEHKSVAAPPVEPEAPPAKPEELRVLKIIGHADTVTAAAFFASGTRLVTGSADASLRVWDASSGRELARFKSHTLPVVAVAATADGRLLAS